jgi:hypothetical protein
MPSVETGENLNGFVLIEENEYDYFLYTSYTLAQLEAAGVENWEGYQAAIEADI